MVCVYLGGGLQSKTDYTGMLCWPYLLSFGRAGVGVGAYLSLSGSGRDVGWSGRLFNVGANSRLGAYSNKHGKWQSI